MVPQITTNDTEWYECDSDVRRNSRASGVSSHHSRCPFRCPAGPRAVVYTGGARRTSDRSLLQGLAARDAPDPWNNMGGGNRYTGEVYMKNLFWAHPIDSYTARGGERLIAP